MQELYQKESYQKLVRENAYNTLEFLLSEDRDFGIVCHTNVVDFNPPIPKDILVFDKITLFLIAGYSRQSATVESQNFSFEAGFGESNFGSFVTVPLEAIAQILLDDEVIYINYFEPKEQNVSNSSMELLLKNPENLKLLKKSKK